MAEQTEFDLYDAGTAEVIGLASEDDVKASDAAAEKDGGSGIFEKDGRKVYVLKDSSAAAFATYQSAIHQPRDKPVPCAMCRCDVWAPTANMCAKCLEGLEKP